MRSNFLLTILTLLLTTTFAAPLIAERADITDLAAREPGDLATRSGPIITQYHYGLLFFAGGSPLPNNFNARIVVKFIPAFAVLSVDPAFSSVRVTAQADKSVTLDVTASLSGHALEWVVVLGRVGRGQDYTGVQSLTHSGAPSMFVETVSQTA